MAKKPAEIDWDRQRAAARQALPEMVSQLPEVLLPYQQNLLATTAANASLSVILCTGHNRGEGDGYAEQIEESSGWRC